jgi:hypothetical protein
VTAVSIWTQGLDDLPHLETAQMMNRRQLMKLLAASPFFIPGSRNLFNNAALAFASPCNCVNILLHGLFFLEFQNNILVVVSPDHNGHCYRFRDHGGPLGPLPSPQPVIDLTTQLDGGNTIPPYPAEMLQYKAADVTARKPYIALAKHYGLVLKLPYPQHIYTLRTGNGGDFHPDPSTNIYKAMKPSLGARIGTITWLQYGPRLNPGFVTRTFYAEHGSLNVPYTAVNLAFGAAQNVFSDFDLLLTADANSIVGRDDPSQLPTEIHPDDERALAEMTRNNCLVAALSKNATPDQRVSKGKKSTARSQGGGVLQAAVEVATCPQFGIIS